MAAAAPVSTGYPNKRARTRRALVLGAMAVVAKGPGANFTVGAVCKQAGVSHGTFYNYFDSVDVLRTAVADELADVFELGAGQLARLAGDPAARVSLGIQQLLTLPTTDRVYAEAFIAMMSRRTELRQRVREVVASEVRKGIDRGIFHSASANVATDALVGVVLQTLRSMLLGDSDGEAEIVVATCLRLLGVPDAQVAEIALRVAT